MCEYNKMKLKRQIGEPRNIQHYQLNETKTISQLFKSKKFTLRETMKILQYLNNNKWQLKEHSWNKPIFTKIIKRNLIHNFRFILTI